MATQDDINAQEWAYAEMEYEAEMDPIYNIDRALLAAMESRNYVAMSFSPGSRALSALDESIIHISKTRNLLVKEYEAKARKEREKRDQRMNREKN